jgi:hypothetical protein
VLDPEGVVETIPASKAAKLFSVELNCVAIGQNQILAVGGRSLACAFS